MMSLSYLYHVVFVSCIFIGLHISQILLILSKHIRASAC